MKFFKFLPLIFLSVYLFITLKPVFIDRKIPIPADTIVGLYHPWRDFFAREFPRGIPFKNFQITDSVRQQYPWRQLAVDLLKRGELPLWNPYSFVGSPLLANLQSAPFYPLNILYWLVDFVSAWTIQVTLQTILGAFFMILYLRHLRLRLEAQILGALCWVGSGFFVAWWEWNTTVQVAIWLPLIFLAIDKILQSLSWKTWFWSLVFVFSLAASFLAGYLQPFFYIFLFSLVYLFFRVFSQRRFSRLFLFLALYLVFLLLVSIQLLPTLQFILLSARDIDQNNWLKPDWFLPWQNLAQLLAPDYFGNPATLNYFGVWNYQEFVSYVGIGGLIFAACALLFRREAVSHFFSKTLLIALVLALPTPIAKLPFWLHLPFLSTAQPSRLILLVDFSLCLLAALGLDQTLKKPLSKRQLFSLFLPFFLGLAVLWFVAIHWRLSISLHNLYLPTALLLLTGLFFLWWRKITVFLLLLLIVFDLGRFFLKFESFSPKDYLYPPTQSLDYLQVRAKEDTFRIATTDDRLLPPNFSTVYRLQTISGYDPLYLRRYGEFIIALERGKPDISSPWGFNRIIVPKNYSSKFFDLLGVKYLLSLNEIKHQKYKLVFQEEQTRIYENTSSFPRAFFVSQTLPVSNDQNELETLFSPDLNLRNIATVRKVNPRPQRWANGSSTIVRYSENELTISTSISTNTPGFLVVTDSFYPGWQATIDGRPTKIYLTDYLFRGVIVPSGEHIIQMKFI